MNGVNAGAFFAVTFGLFGISVLISNTREIHGATHIVYMNNNKMFHVILLEDLLHFIKFQNSPNTINVFQSKYTIE